LAFQAIPAVLVICNAIFALAPAIKQHPFDTSGHWTVLKLAIELADFNDCAE